MAEDRRSELAEQARPVLLASFADRGVVRVGFVAAWPEPAGVALWLCTETDAARNALGIVNPARAEVKTILHGCGLGESDLSPALLATVAQSQDPLIGITGGAGSTRCGDALYTPVKNGVVIYASEEWGRRSQNRSH